MNIAIFSTNVAGIYSGGRYLSLIMAYALARTGAKVTYYTNLIPAFNGDFEAIHQESPVEILTEEHWPQMGDPTIDWVIVIPTGSLADAFYSRARTFAKLSQARIALLSFETANWFNDMAQPMRSALPWEGWASVLSDGGLVLTIAEQGIPYARQFYESLCPGATLLYDFWHPAINDLSANRIGWRDIPTYPNRLACFVRTQDQHKGASDLLSMPPAFFRGKTLCLIFGRGIDWNFVAALRTHTASVTGCRIYLYEQVTDDEKMALLASSAVLLFPSRFEGFGYPPVEAAYVGTPTAAYDLPVLRETLGAQAGLVAVGDVAALAQEAHRLANAEPEPSGSLPIPARCELIQAGNALMASLARAETNLQPPGVPSAKFANTTASAWSERSSCWIDAAAVLGEDGTVSINGFAGARDQDLPITIRVEGIDVVKFGEIVSPFPGAYHFHCRFEESVCASRGVVRIAAWKDRQLLERADLAVRASPEQKLAGRARPSAALSAACAAIFSIEDADFGRSYAERLGLRALLSEASILGYAPVLEAADEVIQRLAATTELSGTIATLASATPDFAPSSETLRFRVLAVDEEPAQFVRVEKEPRNRGAIYHCHVNRRARLIGRKNPLLAFVNRALPGKIGTASLYLLNGYDHQGIRPDALELASLVVARLGQAYRSEICFVTPDQKMNISGYQVTTEVDFVALDHIEGALLTDCARDDAERALDTMGPFFADVAVLEFASIEEAATDICRKIQKQEAATAAQGVLREVVPPLQAAHAPSLPELRHATRLKKAYNCTFENEQNLSEEKCTILGGVIYKSSGSPHRLSNLIRGTRHRIHPDFLEIRTTDSIVLEFDIIDPCDSLTIDAVLMVKTSDAKSAGIEISCNGGERTKRNLRANIFERVTCVFDLSGKQNAYRRHRLEIFVSDQGSRTTLRIRAASFLLEKHHALALSTKKQETKNLPLLQFPSRQQSSNSDRPAFELGLGAPEAVIACGNGWGDREPGYRWTVGHLAELLLPYQDGWPVELELAVTASAFLAPGELSADMIVQIGARQIGIMTFGQEPGTQMVIIPEVVARAGFEQLELIIERPRSPASLGLNEDIRELGFRIMAIAIRKAGTAVPKTDWSDGDDAQREFGGVGA
ncbi:hypothetical protein FHS91_001107 [Sphingobium xanthum]|uniref:glycosyltransferase n=1 Tax=Sphingobium xanthum TaxID=1387165 RepID=UPI001FE43DAD|nr:glycosyltransferase [Sphingobium xanthum]